ncbi:Icl1f, partial [Symbiodinium pilosum]
SAWDVTDSALCDLKEVLLRAQGLFARLRALGLLAAGAAVEEAIQELYIAGGCPKQVGPEVFEEAFGESGQALLARLEETLDDEAATKLVHEAYKDIRPESGLALFLLGRFS